MPDTTPRDQLAEIIQDELDGEGVTHFELDAKLARRLEGWRPPPRRIDSIAELDALPKGAVIRGDSGRIVEKVEEYVEPDTFGYRSDWMEPQEEFSYGTDEIDDFPVTVLYEPEEER